MAEGRIIPVIWLAVVSVTPAASTSKLRAVTLITPAEGFAGNRG